MCNTFVRQLADKRNRTGDKFGRVSDVRLKLCQTEKPGPSKDCDGKVRGAFGHFPSLTN